jgi:hypothetical protein
VVPREVNPHVQEQCAGRVPGILQNEARDFSICSVKGTLSPLPWSSLSCAQVLRCLTCLTRPRASDMVMRPDTRITILPARGTQCMWDV